MSLRNFIKRYLPNKKWFDKQTGMRFFYQYLHKPDIWHVHKRSSAGGAAVGVFCAFIPLPIQIFISAILSIVFRVNLPIAVLCSFISNPFTIPAIFFFCYRLGVYVLGGAERSVDFTLSWDNFGYILNHIWEPLLLGCLVMGTACSVLTYLLVRLIWRVMTVSKWEKRRK